MKSIKTYIVLPVLLVIVGFGVFHAERGKASPPQAPKSASGVPMFQVDPMWPKRPLPNNMLFGQVGGVYVDSDDHIWVASRPKTLGVPGGTEWLDGAARVPPISGCCVPAPPITEFDEAGNYIQGFGGPGSGYEWVNNPHGIFVDYKGNVWIGGNTAKQDNQVLKFSHTGKFLMQIGHAGKTGGSNDTENVNQSTGFFVWPKTNEVFISDGYGNRRVIVFDADTGAYKRHWGAYGKRPDDSVPNKPVHDGSVPQQFNTVHSVRISNDGVVYVADRVNRRVQMFTIDGKFVKETFIAEKTLDTRGTVFDFAFSPDKEQKFIYIPDGSNDKVMILDRKEMQIVGSFGHAGPYAGQWIWLHSIAADSKGNIFTGESNGSKVQKFLFKGYSTTSQQN